MAPETNPFEQSNGEDQFLGSSSQSQVEVVPASALEALNRAEVDIAIATAKRWKRDVADSIKMCSELALRNPQIARTCNYAVPRGGKILVGPSVHFARIVAYSWGNATALARVIGCDRANAHLQGVFHDLQTNLRIGREMDWPVQAPKTDTPERWADQMNLAKRAGAAVALRTAIFDVIPMALFFDIAERAKQVAVGAGKSFEESRNAAIAAFKAQGVTQAQIYKFLDRGGLESITTDDLIYLHGILVSIQERTTTAAEVFGFGEKDPVKAQVPKGRGKREEEVKAAEEPPPVASDRGSELVKKMKEEVGTAASPASAPQEETKKPEPKKEPVAKKEEPKKEEPPKETKKPEGPTVLTQVREQMEESGITEGKFLEWLRSIQMIGHAVGMLEAVPEKTLKIALSDWAGVVDQIKGGVGA
jgi:outer membrane biosynthesis protein TonB